MISLALNRIGNSIANVGMAFCLAGCDFSPSFYGIGHELFALSLLQFKEALGAVQSAQEGLMSKHETHICLTYLYKAGKRHIGTTADRNRRLRMLQSNNEGDRNLWKEMASINKTFFVSEYKVGSLQLLQDVRNMATDVSSLANQLIPDTKYTLLHVK